MRARLFTLAAALATFGSLAGSAPAQCVSLGTPGLTGCFGFTLLPVPAPIVSCYFTIPFIGNAGFKVVGSNLFCAPFLAVGTCAGTPTPFPAGTPFCSPASLGCLAFIDYVRPFLLLAPAPGPEWPLPIPNDPSLVGAILCAQAFGFGTGFCGSCVAVSNGLRVTILP
ncbi:MAG: hypothetical protein L0323_10125 [Planctomycetes bacterium]|nr:hypothetical protein [Planctomycetota bacterium]